MMSPQVEKFREEILSYPLFANLGKPTESYPVMVKSKTEAIRRISSRKWNSFSGICIQSYFVIYRANGQLPPWGEMQEEYRYLYEPTATKIYQFFEDWGDWFPTLGGESSNHFWYAFIELMFLYPGEGGLFYKHFMPAYAEGRLPCGWDGVHPQYPLPDDFDPLTHLPGKLIVY
jgi:hypothetical protein